VDRRWENRSILVNLLKPLGFEVIEAASEQEGLQKAHDSTPNLIILDMARPLIQGFTFLQQIRQSPQLKDIAVIVSSASVFETDQTQILAAGTSAFLPKPIQAHELLEGLKSCLKLEWVYESVDQSGVDQTESIDVSALEATTMSNQAIVPPSNQDLELLYDLILQGAVREILQHLDHLERQQDGNLMPFIQKLRQSVQKFQLKQARDFLEQYLQQQA
jgi:CheY-like chemotaxis protein